VVRMTPERTYYDVLRNEGLEDLRVAGRVFHMVKISHHRESAPPNVYRSIVTGWKDMTAACCSMLPTSTSPMLPKREPLSTRR
jgi:hypothetical protein